MLGLDVVSTEELSGGTYNAAYRLTLADGRRLILKIAPTSPGLTYEIDLLTTEATFYRLTADVAPVPSVVHAAPGSLLMTELPGTSWYSLRAEVAAADHRRLRAELGTIVARLHTVTGSSFGYPSRLPHPTWRTAFTTMVDDVLADSVRYNVSLLHSVDFFASLIRRHGPLLDVVTTPRLVHFDLWDGNILLDGTRLSGIVDGERAFWGDPLAEFVSLSLFKDLDPDLLDAYRAAGGVAEFDPVRLALYRTYLYLIMLVEMTPRNDHDPDRAHFVTTHLTEALDMLR